jgi:hypothetical protein
MAEVFFPQVWRGGWLCLGELIMRCAHGFLLCLVQDLCAFEQPQLSERARRRGVLVVLRSGEEAVVDGVELRG